MLLTAAWLAVALLAASPCEADERKQSATFGPIHMVPGTHLVVGGLNIGVDPVTLRITYASVSEARELVHFSEEFDVPVANKTGVRSFGGDSSGVIGPVGGWETTVTITALVGNLADIVATLQLVDDETDRPIVVLAKPCQRCD